MSIQGCAAPIHSAETSFGTVSPELAFLLRHGIEQGLLLEAVRSAEASGVPADQALIRGGLLSETEFYRALAAETGLPFIDAQLAIHPRARFPESILTGIVPLVSADPAGASYAYAPVGDAIPELLAKRHRLASQLVIATPRAIRESVIAARGIQVASRAADGLAIGQPELSYRGGATRAQFVIGYMSGFTSGVLCVAYPDESAAAASIVLGLAFLGTTALRLAAVLDHVPVQPPRLPPRTPDRDLPFYTVLVALHREARVLPRLVGALEALDYPPAKLQVVLIIEADDRETADALLAIRLPGFAEVVVAPPGEPRTKPRALNVALPLARGEFVTVYDAEDVPDPGQLRLAASVFGRCGPDVACLQARLVIDNAADGWLTRGIR